jgi:hypothetical protein
VAATELFGPEEMKIPAHGWVERQVEVVPVRFKGGKACWDRRAVTRKRCDLWHHRLRNRLIGRLARSLAAGDRADLSACIPGLENIPAFPLPARVVVVVEGEEHADALKAKLPDWPVDAPAAGRLVGQILTFDGLRSRTLEDVDVIVRADAGTGLLPLGPFAVATPSYRVSRSLFVVDVIDDNHPELRQAVNQRTKAYLDAGWRPATCDAVDVALFSLFGVGGHQ